MPRGIKEAAAPAQAGDKWTRMIMKDMNARHVLSRNPPGLLAIKLRQYPSGLRRK